jgi:hypothetical protein
MQQITLKMDDTGTAEIALADTRRHFCGWFVDGPSPACLKWLIPGCVEIMLTVRLR